MESRMRENRTYGSGGQGSGDRLLTLMESDGRML